jgi:hypothetical protein
MVCVRRISRLAISGSLYPTWKVLTCIDLFWTKANFSIDDERAAIALNPFNIQTFDSDLSTFRDLGGKILHW